MTDAGPGIASLAEAMNVNMFIKTLLLSNNEIHEEGVSFDRVHDLYNIIRVILVVKGFLNISNGKTHSG